jgi:uncharacterized protein (DUF302 family)
LSRFRRSAVPLREDLRTVRSDASFEEVLERLHDIIHERGMKLFAEIDHAQNARDAGLEMPETRVLIFGSGRAGTPLMIAAPDMALELPLRILVREEPKGSTVLVYTDPVRLAAAFGVEDLAPSIAGLSAIAQAVSR